MHEGCQRIKKRASIRLYSPFFAASRISSAPPHISIQNRFAEIFLKGDRSRPFAGFGQIALFPIGRQYRRPGPVGEARSTGCARRVYAKQEAEIKDDAASVRNGRPAATLIRRATSDQ